MRMTIVIALAFDETYVFFWAKVWVHLSKLSLKLIEWLGFFYFVLLLKKNLKGFFLDTRIPGINVELKNKIDIYPVSQIKGIPGQLVIFLKIEIFKENWKFLQWWKSECNYLFCYPRIGSFRRKWGESCRNWPKWMEKILQAAIELYKT